MNKLFYISFVLLMISCSKNNYNSLVMLGVERAQVEKELESFAKFYKAKDKVIYYGDPESDTISFTIDIEAAPLKGWFVFENDECILQSINMYCSPCYDQAVNDIIKDKHYKFTKIDKVNYISKDGNCILRIVDKESNVDGACSNILAKLIDQE